MVQTELQISVPGRAQELHRAAAHEPVVTTIYLPDALVGDGMLRSASKSPLRVALFLHGHLSNAESRKTVIKFVRSVGFIVIAPTTSRKTCMPVGSDRYAWAANAFEGKGFADEEEDFLRGWRAGMQVIHDRYGDRVIELTLIGHSYGGTIAAHLAGTLLPQRLILLAPSVNILQKSPAAIAVGDLAPTIEEVIFRSKGVRNVTVIRGTADHLVSRDDCEKYFGTEAYVVNPAYDAGVEVHADDARRTYIEISGMDHGFVKDGQRCEQKELLRKAVEYVLR